MTRTHLVVEALVHVMVEYVNVRPVLHVDCFQGDHALQPQVLALQDIERTKQSHASRQGETNDNNNNQTSRSRLFFFVFSRNIQTPCISVRVVCMLKLVVVYKQVPGI